MCRAVCLKSRGNVDSVPPSPDIRPTLWHHPPLPPRHLHSDPAIWTNLPVVLNRIAFRAPKSAYVPKRFSRGGARAQANKRRDIYVICGRSMQLRRTPAKGIQSVEEAGGELSGGFEGEDCTSTRFG